MYRMILLSMLMASFVLAATTAYAWSGIRIDTGQTIVIDSYDQKEVGAGKVTFHYPESSDEVHSGTLELYPRRFGSLHDDEADETFEVRMAQ